MTPLNTSTLTTKNPLQIALGLCIALISSCHISDKKKDQEHKTSGKEVRLYNTTASDDCRSVSYNMTKEPVKNMLDTPQVELGVKKLIKDGSLTFNCKDLESSKHSLDSLLAMVGGYYEEENLRKDEEETRYYLKLRLPAALFESFMTSLEGGLDELRMKNIEARDITEQYIDVEKRLANQRAHFEQYKSLLAQARTVEDMVAVQEHMEELQSNIESQEGIMKFWNDQIALSTITVELVTEFTKIAEPEKEVSILDRIWNSLASGVGTIVDIFFFLIRIWPFVLATIAIWWYVKRKKKATKQVEKNAA